MRGSRVEPLPECSEPASRNVPNGQAVGLRVGVARKIAVQVARGWNDQPPGGHEPRPGFPGEAETVPDAE